jgi:4-amino-4-deoxy-L-arabinose transferase-like glycosyltransferase
VFDIRPSPARVSVEAAAPIPRLLLLGLLAAYIVAGLIGREPWYPDDAAGFGVMWTMAHGTRPEWWLPSIAGDVYLEDGPLPFWLGAVLMRALGPWLGDPMAARLSCIVWFVMAAAALWYATYRLARRDDAQPVVFVFGGEANPRDYGRMLADVAVLLFLGTVGVVLRLHLTPVDAAAMAFVCLALFAVALALDRPWLGALLLGLAVGGVALSRGPSAALWSLLACGTAFALTQQRERRWLGLVLAIAVAALVFAVWPLGADVRAPRSALYFEAWGRWARSTVAFATGVDLLWIARNFPWATWPLWPFAGWAMYAWRHGWRRPHVLVPAVVTVLLLLLTFATQPIADGVLMPVVPPLAILAAFGAVTLRKGSENTIDWFAIVGFTFLALVVWSYFIAAQTGTPPKMALSVRRLSGGYDASLGVLPLSVATLATLVWIALVIWRIALRPPMLWRGALLAAGGTTMLWLLMTTLILPYFNNNRTYTTLAREVAARARTLAGEGACVQAHRLQPGHRALFAYYGNIRFGREIDGEPCPLALHRDSQRTALDDEPPLGQWNLVWQTVWPARPDETLRLYRRQVR